MAKRADMLRQQAELRKRKVPIHVCKAVRGVNIRMIPPINLRHQNKDGKQGEIRKMVSAVVVSIIMKGMEKPISFQVPMDIDGKWNARKELELGVRRAITDGIGMIADKYEAAMKEKAEREAAMRGEDLPDETVAEETVDETPLEVTDVPEETVATVPKRGPGRPRKNPEPQLVGQGGE